MRKSRTRQWTSQEIPYAVLRSRDCTLFLAQSDLHTQIMAESDEFQSNLATGLR